MKDTTIFLRIDTMNQIYQYVPEKYVTATLYQFLLHHYKTPGTAHEVLSFEVPEAESELYKRYHMRLLKPLYDELIWHREYINQSFNQSLSFSLFLRFVFSQLLEHLKKEGSYLHEETTAVSCFIDRKDKEQLDHLIEKSQRSSSLDVFLMNEYTPSEIQSLTQPLNDRKQVKFYINTMTKEHLKNTVRELHHPDVNQSTLIRDAVRQLIQKQTVRMAEIEFQKQPLQEVLKKYEQLYGKEQLTEEINRYYKKEE